jgi:hypothetical protein
MHIYPKLSRNYLINTHTEKPSTLTNLDGSFAQLTKLEPGQPKPKGWTERLHPTKDVKFLPINKQLY